MTVRLFTNREILNAIKRRVAGSKVIHIDESMLLDECDLALQKITRKGDQVGDSGWIWLVDQFEQTITFGASGQAITPFLAPDYHRGVSLRAEDGNAIPIVYQFVSPREARSTVANLSDTGEPYGVWIEDYDAELDEYSFRFWPPMTSGATMTVTLTYQRGLSKMTTSPLASNRVRIPAAFAAAIIAEVSGNILRDHNLHRKAADQFKEFDEALNDMMIHHRVQSPQEVVRAASEIDIEEGRHWSVNTFLWPDKA